MELCQKMKYFNHSRIKLNALNEIRLLFSARDPSCASCSARRCLCLPKTGWVFLAYEESTLTQSHRGDKRWMGAKHSGTSIDARWYQIICVAVPPAYDAWSTMVGARHTTRICMNGNSFHTLSVGDIRATFLPCSRFLLLSLLFVGMEERFCCLTMSTHSHMQKVRQGERAKWK